MNPFSTIYDHDEIARKDIKAAKIKLIIDNIVDNTVLFSFLTLTKEMIPKTIDDIRLKVPKNKSEISSRSDDPPMSPPTIVIKMRVDEITTRTIEVIAKPVLFIIV